MLSGVADENDVERAKQAGVDAFFDKSDFREGGLAREAPRADLRTPGCRTRDRVAFALLA